MESQPNSPAEASPSPKLRDQVRQVMRLRHYSIHTERAYLDWIKRYVHFHRMKQGAIRVSQEGLRGHPLNIKSCYLVGSAFPV